MSQREDLDIADIRREKGVPPDRGSPSAHDDRAAGMLKVLYLISGLHPGGKERRLVELLKYMTASGGVSMELGLMSREIRYPAVLDLPVTIHYLIRGSRKDPRIFGELFRLCRSSQPDVVHTWDSMTSIYAAPVTRLLGIPLMNGMVIDAPRHLRMLSSPWLRAKMTFALSDIIVANSEAGLYAYHVPLDRAFCVHNGFDLNRLANLEDPQRVRKRFGISTPLVVGMVGAFADRKDYETYIRAAERVCQVRRDVTFVAVGDGQDLTRIRGLVSTQWTSRILFLGWQADVESIMQTLDVGVLATNAEVHGEGIPNSVLEYMALGKPVVATDAGGTRELVDDGNTGWLVADGDDEGIADRIRQLLDDPVRSKSMGEKARLRVQAEFSIESMGCRYRDLYNRLRAGGSKRPGRTHGSERESART